MTGILSNYLMRTILTSTALVLLVLLALAATARADYGANSGAGDQPHAGTGQQQANDAAAGGSFAPGQEALLV